MAARRLTAKERRELPARAFGIPSQRKYPVMVLDRKGEPKFSKSHAVDAKARAKEGLEKGWIDRRQYNQICRKADAAIKAVDRDRAKSKRKSTKKKTAKRKVAKKKTTRRKVRKNPSTAEHEAVGIKALSKSEGYWKKYVADPNDHKSLVDAYKFLVIAHEELKYSDDPEPRLQADHALKRAHREISKLLS